MSELDDANVRTSSSPPAPRLVPVGEEGLHDLDVVRVPATDVEHPGVVAPGNGAVLQQVPGQAVVETARCDHDNLHNPDATISAFQVEPSTVEYRR